MKAKKKKKKNIQQKGNNTLQSHGTKINGNGCAVKTFASCTDLACNGFEHLRHARSHGTNRYDSNIFRVLAKDKSHIAWHLRRKGMGNWRMNIKSIECDTAISSKVQKLFIVCQRKEYNARVKMLLI